MTAQFEHGPWPRLKNRHPFNLGMRIDRPRGGQAGRQYLSGGVETAIWDLMAKAVRLPLYQFLGGTKGRVRAYGSTLDFHLDDEQFRSHLPGFRKMGFRAIKVKVRHPDPQWDLHRLGIVREVFGPETDLMIDANEAWSPKETIIRANAFRDAGHDLFWIEDPIWREDYDGYARLCVEIPFARINSGEYVGFSSRRQLLESCAVDVLNISHASSLRTARAATRLAGDFGVPVSIGNTVADTGVHLAASLPECIYLEYADLVWNELAVAPVRYEDGFAILPERPGHGIELDRDKVAEYAEPE